MKQNETKEQLIKYIAIFKDNIDRCYYEINNIKEFIKEYKEKIKIYKSRLKELKEGVRCKNCKLKNKK